MERGCFHGRTLLLVTGLVKRSWRLISSDYSGEEQELGALNAYGKDLLCGYHYSVFKCFESN